MMLAKQEVENKIDQLLTKMNAIEKSLENRIDEEVASLIQQRKQKEEENSVRLLEVDQYVSSLEKESKLTANTRQRKNTLLLQRGFSY
jgi:hypothetical protein